MIEAMEPRTLFSTYYVSPEGSDLNTGTSESSPWQTVAKVNATTFQPGDSILFQYGAQFRATLTASSSGTTSAPITYGAYGDASLGNPVMLGSDLLDASSFTLVSGTTSTYSMSSTTAINWVFDNHQFTHESTDALENTDGNSMYADEQTNINYVEANAESFYYDTTTTTLYINLGGSLTGHVITAATRLDGVESNVQSNLIFQDIDASECAADNSTYGFNMQGGANLTVDNCTVTYSGKHAFGAINTANFVGENLTTSESAPDFVFGGISAYVAFSDQSRIGDLDSSQWINDTYINPNGPYGAFISHGDVNALGTILIKNMVSDGTYGNGVDCQSTGPDEVVTIEGGEFGSNVDTDTDNSVIEGVKFDQPLAYCQISGNDDVIQNCVFTNLSPDIASGHNGGAVVSGTNDVVRFNTFSFTGGPAVDVFPAIVNNVQNISTNANIYANIFDCDQAIVLYYYSTATGSSDLTSNYNVFDPGTDFGTTTGGSESSYTYTQWQAMGLDANSVVADPGFVDPATGNYQLTASSPAVDLYTGTPDSSVTPIDTDFAGNPRPYGAGYDAGAFELQSAKVSGVQATLSGPSTVNEPASGSTTETFTVTLASASSLALTVDYATADGTAIAGTDYESASGTLSFPAGVTSQTFSVQVIPDLANQNNTTFSVDLSNPSAGMTLSNSALPVLIQNLAAVEVSLTGTATVQEPVGGVADAIYTASLAQSSTSTVTVNYSSVDGSGISGTDYTAESGTLTFAPGQTSQSFTVPVITDIASQANTTFSVSISSPSADATLSPTASTVETTITNTPTTVEQLNSHHQYRYTDQNHVPVTIQLAGPGTAAIVFANTSGTDAFPGQILLSDTTAASTLSIISRSATDVGDILVSGSLNSINARTSNSTGRISIAGTVNAINLVALLGQNDISITGSARPVSLSLGSVSGATIESSEVIQSLTATQWLNNANQSNAIAAPAIGRLTVKGAFTPSLNISGVLSTATLGSVSAGTWTVGSAGTITIASTAAPWAATFNGLVRTFTTAGNLSGSLTGPAVAVLNVKGSLSSAALNVASLGRLTVTKAITSSTIEVTSAVAIAAASIAGSTVAAGISGPITLPIASLGTGVIGTFAIKSTAGFASTIVAAQTIKSVSLRAVISTNGGTAFGFDATTYGSFTITPKLHWTSRQPSKTLTAASTGDFQIVVN